MILLAKYALIHSRTQPEIADFIAQPL